MKKYLMLALISALNLHAQAEDAELAEHAEYARFEAYLDGLVAAQFNDYKLAGMTFVMVKDGDIRLSKGYGYAHLDNLTPVDPATHLFRPGSVSKLFTWTAVMQLVEQGKLDLKADVSQYVDQFDIPNEFDTPLTMENLMTHTPGLEDGAAGYLFADEESDLRPLAEVLETYTPTQVARPGAYSSYSNWSTALAGLIVANISGQSFESYVDEHIFQPLGMNYATFDEPLPEGLARHMSTGYVEERGALEDFGFEFIKNFGPAGALSASGADLAPFMIAHLNGGRYGSVQLLQPDTVALMHSNLYGHPGVENWAHGFYEYKRNGNRFITHGGDTIAFHSQLVLDPDERFGFYLSFNAGDGARARGAIVDGIIDYFYQPAPPDHSPQAPEGSAERVADVAGAYRVTRRSFTKLEGVLGLAGDLTVQPGEDGTIIVPGPQQTIRFVEVEPYVFQQVGGQSRLAFDTDDAGNVTLAHLGVFSGQKLSFLAQASTHQLVIVLALLSALFVVINGVRTRGQTSAGAARTGRRLLIAASSLLLVFVIGLGAVLSGLDMNRAVFDFPPAGVGPVLLLPLLFVLCTAGAIGYLVPVWRAAECGTWARIRYTWVTLIFIALGAVMYYWNLLGWNYY